MWKKDGPHPEITWVPPGNHVGPTGKSRGSPGEITWAPKEFSGRFIGGCLDILVQFPGTPFDGVRTFNERYKEDGIIWFIESCDLNVMSVRRALWQLDQAGWFEHVKGFLVGRPVNYADEFLGYGMHDAVTDMLSKFNVPIIMDIDLGHMSPQMPFISGGYGTVRTTEKTIAIEYELR